MTKNAELKLFWFQLHFLEKHVDMILIVTDTSLCSPFLIKRNSLELTLKRPRQKPLYKKMNCSRWIRSCDKVFPTQKRLRNSNHQQKDTKGIKFQGFSSWAFYNRNIINHLSYFLFFLEAWHMVEFLKKPITVEHFFAWIPFCQRVLLVGERQRGQMFAEHCFSCT